MRLYSFCALPIFEDSNGNIFWLLRVSYANFRIITRLSSGHYFSIGVQCDRYNIIIVPFLCTPFSPRSEIPLLVRNFIHNDSNRGRHVDDLVLVCSVVEIVSGVEAAVSIHVIDLHFNFRLGVVHRTKLRLLFWCSHFIFPWLVFCWLFLLENI